MIKGRRAGTRPAPTAAIGGLARNDGPGRGIHYIALFISAVVLTALSGACLEAAEKDYCIECHKTLDGAAREPADKIEGDIHFKRGLSCSDCHGGDPAKEDFTEAKDPAKGFIGRPNRNDIPKFCAKCHADPAYMRKFNPNIRTDQLSNYNQSRHGRLNAEGDQKVAVCISCHDVHGIKEVSDPAAPVFVTNTPKRCSSCHADKEYMKDYAIPTDQMEKYEKSVHGEALLKKGDRGAPACNSCHSSHGAALPTASAVGNVCAQCHSLTRDLFAKSPHKAAHDNLGIPECEACHGNHEIMRTSDDMVGIGEHALCVTCHEKGTTAYMTAAAIKGSIESLKSEMEDSRKTIEKADGLGMEVSDTKFYLDEAKNSLTKSRAYVHSFSKDTVEEIAKDGISSARKGGDAGKKAIREFNFRRVWLAIMILIVLILAAALYLKIRSIEKV